MQIKVKISNKERLFRRLKSTVPGIEKDMQESLEKSGNEWVQKAQAFAPKDDLTLMRSIRWSRRGPRGETTIKVRGSIFRLGTPYIWLLAGNNEAFYAGYQEHGTQQHARQPYFFPSYRLLRRKIRSRLTRSMTKAIKKAGFGTR